MNGLWSSCVIGEDFAFRLTRESFGTWLDTAACGLGSIAWVRWEGYGIGSTDFRSLLVSDCNSDADGEALKLEALHHNQIAPSGHARN